MILQFTKDFLRDHASQLPSVPEWLGQSWNLGPCPSVIGNGALGEISSPGGGGLRVFPPPGDYARSRSEGWGSAPRTKSPGMRQRFAPNIDLSIKPAPAHIQRAAFSRCQRGYKSRLPSASSQYCFQFSDLNNFPRLLHSKDHLNFKDCTNYLQGSSDYASTSRTATLQGSDYASTLRTASTIFI